MPPVIAKHKCIGCGLCYMNCPGDLFVFDRRRKTVELRYPDECWHCGVCRMDCPEGAISIVFPLEMV